MFLPSASIGLTTPVNASATTTGATVKTQGNTRGAVSVASDHAGTLQVQRYLDAAGTIPIGALITQAVAAGTPNSVTWTDGLPALSFITSFVNSAGAVANLTNIGGGLSP